MAKYFFVCCNVIERNGKFLLVQESRQKARGKWNIPGGQIDLKEDVVTCAIREGKEETGFRLRPRYLIGIYQYPILWGHNAIIVVFFSRIMSGRLCIPKDIMDARWFTLSEVRTLYTRKQLMTPHVWESIREYKKGSKLPLKTVQILD